MGLFGGDSKSSTTSNTTSNVDTDSSLTDIAQGQGGISLVKRDAGRAVLNVNGIGGRDLSKVVAALSGAQTAAFNAISASGESVSEIAKSATGAQSETGSILRSMALPVLALIGLIFWLRS